jgi:hypothetical protein
LFVLCFVFHVFHHFFVFPLPLQVERDVVKERLLDRG